MRGGVGKGGGRTSGGGADVDKKLDKFSVNASGSLEA